MRHRSRKMARFYRTQRSTFVAEQLAAHPVCERCGDNPSTDVHEIVRRGQGGSMLSRVNTRCLCRWCHDFIGQNPVQAEVEGFSRSFATLRHPYESEDGYYCDHCNLARYNWRHARTEDTPGDAA